MTETRAPERPSWVILVQRGAGDSLYEAAAMDGAGGIRKFTGVTLPLLTPVIFFNLIMGLIGTFQIFGQAFIMTQGGPENSTLFYVYHLFNNAFRYGRMGYASAMAWVLFAIVLVLISVFIPIAFLGGLTGELYRQFAITISIAVGISGTVALTLTPSLCVMMLKREHKQPGRFFNAFNGWFTRVTHRYGSGVIWMIRRGAIALLLFGGMVLIAAGLWRLTPGSLVPEEDQGFYISAVILPDGASLQRTDKVVGEVVEILKSNPVNQDVVAFTGFDFLGGGFRNNAATIFVTQKPWDERHVNTQQLVGEFFMKTGHIKEGLVLAFAPPAIFGLGTAGGYELYLQNHGEGGPAEMQQALQAMLGRLNSDPMLGGAQTLWRANVPQLFVDVDREKARSLGVPISDVFATLSSTLGSFYVNDFNKYGRTWQVLMSAEPEYRNRPDAINNMWVRSASGEIVGQGFRFSR